MDARANMLLTKPKDRTYILKLIEIMARPENQAFFIAFLVKKSGF